MNAQDFQVGVDFTGLVQATGADVNNGVELANPLKDADETVGKAMILTTTDTALDTPDVPDPTASADYNKWKRYQWNRRPFAGAADKRFQSYIWNDDAVASATYLKWVKMFVDTTAIEAAANNALGTANNAVNIANAANTIAATANNTANTAKATADAAATTATNAANAIAAVSTVADDAKTAAAAADAKAVAAQAANPSYKNYAKVSETQAKGVDAGASAAGKNTRILNTVDTNGANLAIVLDAVTGKVTIGKTGYYRVEASATMYDNSDNQHQLLVVNDTTNVTLLTGFSLYFVAGGAQSQRALLSGLLYLTQGDIIRLDHYIANVQAANGLGRAANVHPDAGGREVYASLELTLISVN